MGCGTVSHCRYRMPDAPRSWYCQRLLSCLSQQPVVGLRAGISLLHIPFFRTISSSYLTGTRADLPQAYAKGAIYRQMQEYGRKATTAESRLEELHKRSVHHDDHLRIVDAWWLQVSLRYL